MGLKDSTMGKKGKYHNGHDIAAKTGTPIFAPSSGKVILTGHYYYNGKFVMMNHGNNLISIFLHMDTINVQEGIVLKKETYSARSGALDCLQGRIFIGL